LLIDRLVYPIDLFPEVDRKPPRAKRNQDNECQGDGEATPEPDGILGRGGNSGYHLTVFGDFLFGVLFPFGIPGKWEP
jgi:hypothetical protein